MSAIEQLLGKLIEVDYRKCGGLPVLRGTRIPVGMVVALLERGWKPDEISEEFDIPVEVVKEVARNLRILKKFCSALNLIEIDRRKLRGMPVVRGTRVPAYYVYSLTRNGWRIEKILEEFPTLRRCDVEALLEYRDVLEPFLRKIYEKLTSKLHNEIGRVI